MRKPTRAPASTTKMNWPHTAPTVNSLTKKAFKQNSPSVAPMGSIRIPSQRRIVDTGGAGRARRRRGSTTVGPDTTRMAPRSAESRRDSWKRWWTVNVVRPHVMSVPTDTSRNTGRRIPRPSSSRSSARPPRNNKNATASDTTVNSESPKMTSGSTAPSSGPSSIPPTRSKMMEGTRSSAANH